MSSFILCFILILFLYLYLLLARRTIHKKTAKQGKEARKWVKEYTTLNEWFNEYISKRENQCQQISN